MTGEGETAADALTGAVVASAVEPKRGEAWGASEANASACLNCGTALTGAYCVSCGQSAHIHRTFRSLGRELLHSVFHFDGKFWRTIPYLVFHPGELTRRYIDGERAKFISPMALFLFAVFLMYAVSAFTPDFDWNDPPPLPDVGWPTTETGLEATVESMDRRIDDLRAELADPTLSVARRAAIEQALRELELSRDSMYAALTGDWEHYSELREQEQEQEQASAASNARRSTGEDASSEGGGSSTDAENIFTRAWQKLEEEPDLVLYKMKSNGYKWSWLLVPLSIPFIWALFFWRREFPLYDHAVFVTYSIAFMMLLVIVTTLAEAAGVGARARAALLLVPPLHIYKQLRGNYGLSRPGAFGRLFFVLGAAVIVLAIFLTMLLLMGALD